MRYFIANWKANKTFEEVKDWLRTFNKRYSSAEEIIIICPPFIYLTYIYQWLMKKKFKNVFLGSQDISAFEPGPYTGEIPASLLSFLIKFVILGHSERRKYQKETSEIIEKKINLALENKIQPIVCLSKLEEKPLNMNNKILLAYEPIEAIGTGNNASLREVLNFKKNLHLKTKNIFLYGGSVNEINIGEYLHKEINGFLIGSNSLDPNIFCRIINKSRV